MCFIVFFFFQAEDGIRDAQESRGLGDVYKRQDYTGIGPAGNHGNRSVSAGYLQGTATGM